MECNFKYSLSSDMLIKNRNKVNKKKLYIGATENEWKKEYYNHRLCFKYIILENIMMLSVYYQKVKREVEKSTNLLGKFLRKVDHVKILVIGVSFA